MRKLVLIAAALFIFGQISFAQGISAQWQNSRHANPVWSSSFAQGAASQNNNLQNCVRCHDGNGFVNFTMNLTTQTDTLTQAGHRAIDCSTCHDGAPALRATPTGSDTLANGFSYAGITTGSGNLCMNCHKGRRDADTYAVSPVSSSHWGPHYSVQTDVLLGQNAAKFGANYSTADPNFHISTMSANADGDGAQDACIDCHKPPTPAAGQPGNNLVGGHTFRLHDDSTGVDLVNACTSCHGSFATWDEFKPSSFSQDYDGNGNAESVQKEVQGLLTQLRMALPPAGQDSIDWAAIQTAADTNLSKAYYNWQVIDHDGSLGIHNPQYAVSVLQASLNLITGVKQENNLVPTDFALEQNYPNPFNPVTTITFSLPEAANVTLKVYDAVGNEIATLHQGQLAAGTFSTRWVAAGEASGIYFYKLTSDKFNMTKKMILMK